MEMTCSRQSQLQLGQRREVVEMVVAEEEEEEEDGEGDTSQLQQWQR